LFVEVASFLAVTILSPKPHAVTDTGDKLYTYDPAGNMTGWTHKQNGTRRVIYWNEENRVKQIDDNGKKTYFLYDDTGERVLKRGEHGETLYINRFYSIRNGELSTKHVFAGETRILSKLVKTPPTSDSNTDPTFPGSRGILNALGRGKGNKFGIFKRIDQGELPATLPVEKDQFYYHTDHLGSSNIITDTYGSVYQHLEYFPYGETWIEEGGSYEGNTPGYKFTGKELDPETGLYYFGARYYDPVLSRWISADPILGKYLPDFTDILQYSKAWNPETRLPSNGGVFRPTNLNLYAYTLNNPTQYTDPSGKWSSRSTLLSQPVHQMAIQNVLGPYVDPRYIQVMQQRQVDIDTHQRNVDQYMHAMTGAGQERNVAVLQANEFVTTKLNNAKEAFKSGDLNRAYSELGDAIHTLQDATSPSHREFQVWDERSSTYEQAMHSKVERNYPAAGTRERTELEGVTRWAYDIFQGKVEMPKNFFEPGTGYLLLPEKYLQPQ
jgi:RHS repeat-associated protein